ncbi:restriction endonuclease subunit S [Thioalkalicoccus limnaeus]|uniref:Restriction endonuclease subunit S n=1 Tax=Thioalkalicoccus limnaeus TaxID=120681 RepID=A0ABV4BB47_9GAMM
MLTHRHDTIIGDIPKDWQPKPLKSLLEKQFSGDWGADEGEQAVSVLRSTNFTDSGALDFSDVATRYFSPEKAATFGLKKGDLLVERSGGGPEQPVGRIGFITEDLPDGTVSNFVQVLRPNPEKVDPDFLGWVLYELQRTGIIERVQQQSTQMRNLNWRDYQRLLLPWPDIDEQRRIAAALKLADDAIAKAKAELEATRELKRSLMQTLFVFGMPGRHSDFLATKIGPVPKDWNIKKLGEIIVSCQYGLSESMAESGRFPILRMNNIDNGIVNANDVKYIDLDDATFELFRLRAGDILFNRTNSMEYVGRVGVVNDDMDAVFASYLVRLVADTSQIDPWFLNFCMNSTQVRNRYRRYATPAVQQANINPRSVSFA